MFRIVFFVMACLLFHALPGQTVSGSWYGKADVVIPGVSSNYLTEFTLKQKGNEVEGIFAYYFKDSYQSFFVRGTYNSKTRQVRIKNLPMLFYGSPTRTGIECPMHFEGTLMVSRAGSSLSGFFYTESKYQYTCPSLRVSLSMDPNEKNPDSLLAGAFSGRRFWQPQEDDVVVMANAPDTGDTLPAVPSSADLVSAKDLLAEEANKALLDEFGKRNNIYEKDIYVRDDSILVSFYDNGDVDDDTISVFLNKQPILVRRGLSSRALNIYIGLDSSREVNELTMFADNLGKYPPNTALMVVSDGLLRYELYLSASLKQNASVRIRRKKAP